MFLIKNKAFYVTRGDRGSFKLGFKNYTFKPGDVIEFKIYEENGLDLKPVLNKSFNIKSSSDLVTLELLSADTSLGKVENEIVDYWYEIKLNGDQTPFCYDENGPKLFHLYPGGKS